MDYMSAENGSTTKIVALVAVVALCCGAFAGAALAYSALYVDDIPEQKIGSVFITVGSDDPVTGYGGDIENFRLDVDYNTLIKKDGGVEKVYYRVAGGSVLDTAGEAIGYEYGFECSFDEGSQTVTFTGCVAEVQLKAYGKEAGGTLKVYGLWDESAIEGISNISYSFKDGKGEVIVADVVSDLSGSYISTGSVVQLSTDEVTDLYLMASFTVSTLNLASHVTVLGSTYYAPAGPIRNPAGNDPLVDDPVTVIDKTTILDDILIPGITVAYKFETVPSN